MTLALKKNGNTFPGLLNDLFDTSTFFGPDIFDRSWDFSIKAPSVNIVENEKDYRIDMAAPGLEKKDFNIQLEDRLLTISSEKQEEKKEEDKNFKRREFSYSSFSRSFQLPEDALAEEIDASYENGILKLCVPKKPTADLKSKKEIKVS